MVFRKYHYIDSNPGRDTITKFGKQGKTPDPYTVEQMRSLLANVTGTWWEPIIVLGGLYGLRLGEILGLRWQNVDLESSNFMVIEQLPYRLAPGTTEVPEMAPVKSGVRMLPITAITRPYFERQLAQQKEQKRLMATSGQVYHDNDLVIAKPNGIPERTQRMSSNFGQLLRHLGMLHMRFHDTRHSAATNMHKLTGDFYTVGQILGYSFIYDLICGAGHHLGTISLEFCILHSTKNIIGHHKTGHHGHHFLFLTTFQFSSGKRKTP